MVSWATNGNSTNHCQRGLDSSKDWRVLDSGPDLDSRPAGCAHGQSWYNTTRADNRNALLNVILDHCIRLHANSEFCDDSATPSVTTQQWSKWDDPALGNRRHRRISSNWIPCGEKKEEVTDADWKYLVCAIKRRTGN